jgi:hypothetical protein
MSRSVEVITTLLNDYNTFLFSSLYTTSIIIVCIEVIKNIQYNIDIYISKFYTYISLLYRTFCILKHLTLSVPDEVYSRNAPGALNWISTFSLLTLS